MELIFNIVEISSKPNAEASSLDYAEARLTFNSVETIPVLNASAVFKTDSGKLFMSDYDMGDGGHVFLHLLSKAYRSIKKAIISGFYVSKWIEPIRNPFALKHDY